MPLSQTLPTIDPEEVINGARERDISQLLIIATHVLTDPRLRTLEVIQIIVSHLDVAKCPDSTDPAIQGVATALAVGRAIHAFAALSNIGAYVGIYEKNATVLRPINDGWNGIWRWMTFFHALSSESQASSLAERKVSFEFTAHMLYSCTIDKTIMSLISRTPGAVALVTTLWMQEDAGALQLHFPQPICSSTLRHFLETDTMLDEVPQIDTEYLRAYVNILITITRNTIRVRGIVRNTRHTLCHAVLHKGGIGLVTRALLHLSATPSEENIRAILSCFFFVSDSIELGTGIPYVREAIQQGLLQAFVNIDADTKDHAARIIADTISRYLVHRSVIVDMDVAMRKLEVPEERAKIDSSPAVVRHLWYSMRAIGIDKL